MTASIRELAVSTIEAAGPGRFWVAADFSEIGLERPQARRALAELACTEALIRVRPGLYWRPRLTRLGPIGPRAHEIARKLAGEVAVGPSGYLALNQLGLSTQVPAVHFYAVPRRLRDVERAPWVRFIDRSRRTDRVAHGLGYTDVAVLEALEQRWFFSEFGEEHAYRQLANVVRKTDGCLGRLAACSSSEPGLVRDRLDVLADVVGQLPR